MIVSDRQMKCDAVLFDLDGVLIDSSSCIVRHWTDWAGRHGLDPNTVLQAAHGVRTIETIRQVAPQLNAEEEARQFDAYELIDMEGVVAIAGANQLLSTLPKDSWAIVTSGPLALVEIRLAKVGLPFPSALVTGDEVSKGKPNPEPYLAGAKILGVPPARCIVVEDAPAGVEAGKKAGARVVGVASTHSREELLEKGADIVAEQLADIGIRTGAGGYRLTVDIQ